MSKERLMLRRCLVCFARMNGVTFFRLRLRSCFCLKLLLRLRKLLKHQLRLLLTLRKLTRNSYHKDNVYFASLKRKLFRLFCFMAMLPLVGHD